MKRSHVHGVIILGARGDAFLSRTENDLSLIKMSVIFGNRDWAEIKMSDELHARRRKCSRNASK